MFVREIKEIIVLRECHRNYAHGPMQLRTKQVELEYHGETLICEKTIYACNHCDFELHLQWMEEKFQQCREKAYLEKHPEAV